MDDVTATDPFGRPIVPDLAEPEVLAPAEANWPGRKVSAHRPFGGVAESRSYPPPEDDTPEALIPATPEERMAGALMALGSGQVRTLLKEMSPTKRQFLKMRAIADTDTKARHLMGHLRRESDKNYERSCVCMMHTPHWLDMREATLITWKHDEVFMRVYDILTTEPMLFAEAWMESLATKALGVYDDSMEPDMDPRIRLRAARDVVEAMDLKPTVGVQKSGQGAKTQRGFQLEMAITRAKRGLEVSDAQRRLIEEAGMSIEDMRPPTRQVMLRDLDGNDVAAADSEYSDETRGGDNSAHLPD